MHGGKKHDEINKVLSLFLFSETELFSVNQRNKCCYMTKFCPQMYTLFKLLETLGMNLMVKFDPKYLRTS